MKNKLDFDTKKIHDFMDKNIPKLSFFDTDMRIIKEEVPEVNINVETTDIKMTKRRLKGKFTVETNYEREDIVCYGAYRDDRLKPKWSEFWNISKWITWHKSDGFVNDLMEAMIADVEKSK